ncbi:MAG: DNA polymerase III subunit delta [Aquabacterium sp.]
MQLSADRLDDHLARGLRPVYTLHGDEPLLSQEAGDAIRRAARVAGCTERKVFHMAGAHVDWSALLGAAQSLSLFAERQLIEIRIPNGKPGKDGSEALQQYCQSLSDDIVTVVHLPRLDRQQQASAWFSALDAAGVSIRIDPVERAALPVWLARRLAAQGQRFADDDAGRATLAFLADRVEGNLLAAHQEIQKLALLFPAGELSYDQVEASVLNVARYSVKQFAEAVLAGQTARALRMLDGLRAEGEAAVLVHWNLTEDIAALKGARDALDQGRPLPVALNERRVWGARQRLFERQLPRLGAGLLAHWLEAASICDGVVKGLRHPDWPVDAWEALRRLTLMMLDHTAASQKGPPLRMVLRA